MKKYFPPVVIALALILVAAAGACKSSTTTATPTTTRPGSGSVINSDSIVTAQIQSITAQSVSDQDMSAYKVNDTVTVKIKYVGDVDIPAGISLYMYNVALQTTPGY